MQVLTEQCKISFGLMLSTFLSSIFLSVVPRFEPRTAGLKEGRPLWCCASPLKRSTFKRSALKLFLVFLQAAFTSGEKLDRNRSVDLSEIELFEVTLEKCSHGPKRKEITIYEGLEFVKA